MNDEENHHCFRGSWVDPQHVYASSAQATRRRVDVFLIRGGRSTFEYVFLCPIEFERRRHINLQWQNVRERTLLIKKKTCLSLVTSLHDTTRQP